LPPRLGIIALHFKIRALSGRGESTTEPVASDIQNSDANEIAGELAASIRKAGVARSRPRETGPQIGIAVSTRHESDGPIEHDLALMRGNYDVASAPFTSHRPLLGRFIIAMKNVVREFLAQLLARQSAYNGAATRAITALKQRLDHLADEQARIVQRVAALESRIGAGQSSENRRGAGSSISLEHDNGSGSRALDDRLEVLEQALGGRKRTGGGA
jgi:hypothetical protein